MKAMLGIVALGAVLAIATGCGTKVVSGIGTGGAGAGTTVSSSTGVNTSGGGNGNGGNGNTGGNSAVGGGTAGTDIAIRWADIPVDPTGTTVVAATSVGSSGGGGPDPDSYEFSISQAPASCANFWGTQCGSWRVSFNIAPASLQVGAIVPESELTITHSVSDPGCNGTSAVGGNGGPGQAEILAIDATSISYRLTNISLGDGIDVNGDHTALICK